MMRALFTTIVLFLSTITVSYAQDVKIADILGENQVDSSVVELDEKEEAREEDFLNQLLLKIPSQTDNPSHIITFIDPSESKSGIQLEIDSKSFQQISSPYALPALGIGKHLLRFKFVDKYGATQILDKELIVLPRPPIINSPSFSDGILTISGTGLANSEIILILSSSGDIIIKNSIIDTEGKWSIIIPERLMDGIYTFSGYARKYGYAGDLAESVTFEYGDGGIAINHNGVNSINFAFKDIKFNNMLNILKENFDLVILIVICILFGGLISSIFVYIFRRKSESKVVKTFEKKIKKENEKDGLTILEKLKGSRTEAPKTEVVKEEVIIEEKPERIVTKIDFLRDYKKHDPDQK